MLPEPRKIENFQDVILNDPVVHAYMTQQLYGDNKNYIETLKKIIVYLVNEKRLITQRTIQELAEKPAQRFDLRKRKEER